VNSRLPLESGVVSPVGDPVMSLATGTPVLMKVVRNLFAAEMVSMEPFGITQFLISEPDLRGLPPAWPFPTGQGADRVCQAGLRLSNYMLV
jgi:hypothetical protein